MINCVDCMNLKIKGDVISCSKEHFLRYDDTLKTFSYKNYQHRTAKKIKFWNRLSCIDYEPEVFDIAEVANAE